MVGFSLAGFLSVILAAMKLTREGQWTWWRVLLPLWVVLGHNVLYIAIGFIWIWIADSGEGQEATVRESDRANAYEWAALVSFLFFADNLLGRTEGSWQSTRLWLRSGQWWLIWAALVISIACQLLFWSKVVVRQGHRRPGNSSGSAPRRRILDN